MNRGHLHALSGYLSERKQSLLLVASTIVVHQFLLYLVSRIPADGIRNGLKRQFFKWVRMLPSVQSEIALQMAQTTRSLESSICKLYIGALEKSQVGIFVTEIPNHGLGSNEILLKLQEYMELGDYTKEEQRLSGASYFTDDQVTELYTSVYKTTLWSNPLHYEVFPGICKMEAEVIRMACNLFGAKAEEGDYCGTVTSGGTESILLAVKAYRDYAINVSGISQPEVVVPLTAHAAFNKAAQLLGIAIRQVPVDPTTCKVDVKTMRKMINRNTCMLVGSAPAYPHGCMDDIVEIGRLGKRYKIPVHVDACLGGFLLAFMPLAGLPIEPFDFKVEGVTSISADTHKYGCSPKGSSILLYQENKYRRFQYFTEANWPGGLYASSTLAGSKCGASIAACWASFLYFGLNGYTDSTRKIIEASRYIVQQTRNITDLEIMGDPKYSIIAWKSKDLDIYSLYDAMNKKGWTLNALQFPSAIHICISYPQTKDMIPEKFVHDMNTCVEQLRMESSSKSPNEGAAAIYGSSQKVPFRELVNETAAIFLDALYKTNFETSAANDNNKTDTT